eukprot:364189-Chlamydomonas_euryale.AAC.11
MLRSALRAVWPVRPRDTARRSAVGPQDSRDGSAPVPRGRRPLPQSPAGPPARTAADCAPSPPVCGPPNGSLALLRANE